MREKFRGWWDEFVHKHKFAILDADDESTRWYMYISPANVVIGLGSFVLLVLLIVVLLVAYTPIMDTIPGYPGRRSREAITRGIMRLDSLERQMANLTVYSNNIDMIMEGRTPVIRNVDRIGDSVQMQDKTLVVPIAADSTLRARMEGSGPWSLARSAAEGRSQGVPPDLVQPIKGLVQERFSPVGGRYGVRIATQDLSPVAAVREGTVILRVFTPGEGYLVQLQHTGNLVSVYRGMAEAVPATGARVKAGEVIGMAGPLIFELWYNGSAVNPENYIVF